MSVGRLVCLAHGQTDSHVSHMGKGTDMSCTWAKGQICLAHGQRDRYVSHMGKGTDMSCTWAKGQICLAHGQRDRYVPQDTCDCQLTVG